ncbi:MAG: WD40 repeat domain-containing protein [Armatimonadota bacterium]
MGSAKRPRWVPRWWQWAGVVLVGLLIWWWAVQPRALTLVARHPVNAPAAGVWPQCWATSDGVCWFNSIQSTMTRVQWDGTISWTASLRPLPPPAHRFMGWRDVLGYWALSPDQRYLVIPSFESIPGTVRIWHDGRLLGTVTLPGASVGQPVVNNSGTIWCASRQGAMLHVLRLNGPHITSYASIPTPPGKLTWNWDLRRNWGLHFSPDGGSLVIHTLAGLTYYPLQTTGSSIQLRANYTAALPPYIPNPWENIARLMPVSVLRRDLLLTGDGALYNAQGRTIPPSGWCYNGFLNYDNPTYTGEQGLLQYQNTVIHNQLDQKWRVFIPATGQTWRSVNMLTQYQAMTSDGRYALAIQYSPTFENSKAAKRLEPVISNWRWLRETLYERHKSPPVRLTIYERPGRLRARSVLLQNNYGHYPLPGTRCSIYCYNLSLSPDGHTMHLFAVCEEDGKKWLEVVDGRW